MTATDWRLAVDIGGTFTDVVLLDAASGRVVVDKTLTTPAAPLEGVRRGVAALMAKAGVRPGEITAPIVHATTLITNALIQGQTGRAALVTTAGFGDTLLIRDEHRYDMYDLQIEFPEPPVPRDRTFELAQTRQLLERASDSPVMLFRPPYGAHNAAVDAAARQLGLLQLTWNVDTQDSEGMSAAGIRQLADEGIRPGAIILMHENKPQTLVALPQILRTIERRGYRSVTIPELLALNPPSDQQVQAGFQGCVDAEHPSKAFSPTGSG